MNKAQQPLIVLWDLGNVVVQWDPDVVQQLFPVAESQKPHVRRQLLDHPDWLRLDQGLTTEAEIARRIAGVLDLSVAQIELCFDAVRESLVDLEPSIQLIREMSTAGIPMYVLSNMSLVNANLLRQRDYFECFSGIVISAEEKLIKPDSELFMRVLKRYSLSAPEVFFIDDSLPNIEAAHKLGMQALHFKRTAECYSTIRDMFGLNG